MGGVQTPFPVCQGRAGYMPCSAQLILPGPQESDYSEAALGTAIRFACDVQPL